MALVVLLRGVAQPVGTGIMVGSDSTVIPIVFYGVSSDRQTGDGVAKDNKGRYYRIYLSTGGIDEPVTTKVGILIVSKSPDLLRAAKSKTIMYIITI